MNFKNWIIVLLVTLVCQIAFSQVVWENTTYDFGIIKEDTERIHDFKLTNNTGKHIFLMRASAPENVKLYYDRSKIEKDSSAYVRVMYNPKSTGSFSEKIELFVSSEFEPVILKIKGTSEYVERDRTLACPDFSSKKPISNRIELVVNVFDAETNKEINGAEVKIGGPALVFENSTNNLGTVSTKTTVGQHQILVSKDGYESSSASKSVTFSQHEFDVYLRKENEEEIVQQEETNREERNSNTEIVVEEYPNIVEEEETILRQDQDDNEEYIPKSDNELPVSEYKPNNVVFLVDVSQSMAKYDKMDLLKIATKELFGILRDFDRVAMITYSGNVDVVIPSTSGAEKEMMGIIVDSLKAGGLTAGGKGIKIAYEIAQQNFIEDGNNQVIICTDGEFNVDEKGYNLNADIRKNTLKGITLSVVGIRNAKIQEQSLLDISKKGRGTFVRIKTPQEAKTVLVEQIKKNSKR